MQQGYLCKFKRPNLAIRSEDGDLDGVTIINEIKELAGISQFLTSFRHSI